MLRGIAASLGVGVGRCVVRPRQGQAVHRRATDPAAEVARLREAIERSRAEIEAARSELRGHAASEAGLVLDAQLLMHSDAMLVEAAAHAIRVEGLGAEWAVERTVRALKRPLEASSSSYFRERAQDVEHVGRHLLRHLRGGASWSAPSAEECVLVADDLSPADAVRAFSSGNVLGVVLEVGSATSHTSLLARALAIPAVAGVRGATAQVITDEVLVVDGIGGEVLVAPEAPEREHAEARGGRYRKFAKDLRARGADPVATREGVTVVVRANLELPDETASALTHGAQGVGLYRTEFMLLHREQSPSEEQQWEVYAKVVRAMAPGPVLFRTFDLGGDKLPSEHRLPPATNPALGLRAMRLLRRVPNLLRAQIRALLRAAAVGDACVMFPMIAGLDDFRRAKALVAECADELQREGIPHRVPAIGCMIEVPSAALGVRKLAREADFLSVGTNDLIQYTLAADRLDPEVAHLVSPFDPSVLQLLQLIVRDAGHTPLSMCGDMASDPMVLPLVLGLGFRVLSTPVGALPLVQQIIRQVEVAPLAVLAEECIEADDAVSVERLVRSRLTPALENLWVEVSN